MNEEKIYPFEETDMWDLITDFNEYSTDYTKTACEYYEEYLRNYQKEKLQLQNNWNKLKKWLEELQQEEFDMNGFIGVCTEIRINCILDKMQELEGNNE